jgi:hypothetical protein
VVVYLKDAPRDADATLEMSHAVFTEMLGAGTIHTADQQRGRARSYVLGAVKHFVSRKREIQRVMKRGGAVRPSRWMMVMCSRSEMAASSHPTRLLMTQPMPGA